jgi:hypothetical protein
VEWVAGFAWNQWQAWSGIRKQENLPHVLLYGDRLQSALYLTVRFVFLEAFSHGSRYLEMTHFLLASFKIPESRIVPEYLHRVFSVEFPALVHTNG